MSTIEPLESRIAPAVIFTFTDVDGDTVKLSSDKAITAAGTAAEIVLSGAGLDGAGLSTAVTRAAGGDGFVNIGRIVATGLDLGFVSVKGDLGKIVCGNAGSPLPALKSLAVRSMGLFGTSTQGAGNLVSDITGDIGALSIAGDALGVQLKIAGSIGTVKIGGDLQGNSTAFSGRIEAFNAGSVTIGGDLAAGSADESGKLIFTGKLGSLKIGGDLLGARDATGDPLAGQVFVGGNAGPISIRGSIIGAVSEQLGLDIRGNAGAITIGGSLRGDAGLRSAGIDIGGSAGAIKIGGSLIGGSAMDSARVEVGGGTGPITVGGSLIGVGEDSASFFIGGNIGALKIGGGLTNGVGRGSGSIYIAGSGAGLSIGGDIVGGIGGINLTAAGQIGYLGDVGGVVKIGGSLIGATGLGGGSAALGDAKSIFIGGSIIGGGQFVSMVGSFPSGSLGFGKVPVVTIVGDIIESPFRGGALLGGSVGNFTIGGSIIGALSVAQQNTTGSQVQINGDLGVAKILGSIVGASHTSSEVFGASFDVNGKVGSLTVSGSLIGGNVGYGGSISISGNAGVVKILGSLNGSTGNDTAALSVASTLGALTIGGSVTTTGGNYGGYGGQVTAAKMGAVKIVGDLITAGGGSPGRLRAGGDIASLTIGGDMLSVIEATNIGAVKIGGDLVAPGGGTYAGINAQRLASLAVGGDVRSFAGGTGAAIAIAQTTGPITIGGDFRAAENGIVRLISGTAFGSIGIKGSIAGAQILAGYNLALAATNKDAAIGTITIGRDFTASSIVAGIKSGVDMLFGTADDLPIAAATPALSRITALTVKGQVFGTAAMSDHFGVIAQQIGPVKVGGIPFATKPVDLGIAADVTVRVV